LEFDINEKHSSGNTPLQIAVAANLAEITKCLIGHKADLATKAAACGRTPAEVAVLSGDQLGTTPLRTAVTSNLAKTVMYLIERRADLTAEEIYGRKPLDMAVSAGPPQMVKFLIAQRADVNAHVGKGSMLSKARDAAGSSFEHSRGVSFSVVRQSQ